MLESESIEKDAVVPNRANNMHHIIDAFWGFQKCF